MKLTTADVERVTEVQIEPGMTVEWQYVNALLRLRVHAESGDLVTGWIYVDPKDLEP